MSGHSEGAAGETVLTRGTVVIDVPACKGCELCIDACPPRVLQMTTDQVNERGYRYPELVAGCIACQACSQICPDFVFQVYRYEQPIELPVARSESAPASETASAPETAPAPETASASETASETMSEGASPRRPTSE